MRWVRAWLLAPCSAVCGRHLQNYLTLFIRLICVLEQVRLLGLDKEMLGVMPTDEAQDMAEEAGVDLVMVSPEASPPVCRIMDYKKYKFDQDKKKKDDAKKQKQLQVSAPHIRLMRQAGHSCAALCFVWPSGWLSGLERWALAAGARARAARERSLRSDTAY